MTEMGAKSSRERRHLPPSIFRKLGLLQSTETATYTTRGICYWPGKPVRFKHRKKLIKTIQEESTAPCPFKPVELADCPKQDLLANEGILPSTDPPSEYPYENLVLSGGGIRGYAYIGAVQALDDAGVLPQIKRFAGASAGAMCATIIAIGYNAQDIAKCFYLDLNETFRDQTCAGVMCVPKMLTTYGLHPSMRYFDSLGTCIQLKAGNADLTFKQYHEMYGKELCIVVSNISKLRTEYCHHTTTPDLPIRMAVRMSMAVPFLYEPVKVDVLMTGKKENRHVYVDGSLGDHFPIRCFDGDTVGLNPNSKMNEKTIGCYLVAERDADYLLWDQIFGKDIPRPTYLPNTKIARSQLKEEIKKRKKMDSDFSSKEFLNQLYTSRESLFHHYEAPNKTAVAIDSLMDVIVNNLESILHNQVMCRLTAEDESRTVPINTGYVRSHDYELEPADREFLINQGYESTMRLLKDYKERQKQKIPVRKESEV